MHVLVTGATGLVGNNVVRKLVQRGDNVRVLLRNPEDQSLADLDVEKKQGDICDVRSVEQAAKGVDQVIHAAGYVQIGWSNLHIHQAVNVQGTENVARAARLQSARMVHVSTCNTIGLGTFENPADESTPQDRRTVQCPYVVTKTAAEQVILNEVAAGLNAVIVNPAFMLGPWDWKPSSGKLLIGMSQRWVPQAPRGGMSFCDVRDVADGVLAAAEKGRVGEKYLLAGQNMPYFDAFKIFASVIGKKPPLWRLQPLGKLVAGSVSQLSWKITGKEPDVNSAALRITSLPNYYSSQRATEELDYSIRPLEETASEAWAWLSEKRLS